MLAGLIDKVTERMASWVADSPAFDDGDWVRFCGELYQVLEVVTIDNVFHYYLNDGSDYPHCEDSLQAA